MRQHEDVGGHFSFQRDISATDLDHKRWQPLMQPQYRTGYDAEGGKAVQSLVGTRGDENDAI